MLVIRFDDGDQKESLQFVVKNVSGVKAAAVNLPPADNRYGGDNVACQVRGNVVVRAHNIALPLD